MYISQRGQVWGSHSDEEREYKVKQTKNIMEKKQDPAYNTEKETESVKWNITMERKESSAVTSLWQNISRNLL